MKLKTIDHLSSFPVAVPKRSVPIDELREILVGSVRECKNCRLRRSIKSEKLRRSVPKCLACRRIIELMPSVREMLE
jgi:hypothetical protein